MASASLSRVGHDKIINRKIADFTPTEWYTCGFLLFHDLFNEGNRRISFDSFPMERLPEPVINDILLDKLGLPKDTPPLEDPIPSVLECLKAYQIRVCEIAGLLRQGKLIKRDIIKYLFLWLLNKQCGYIFRDGKETRHSVTIMIPYLAEDPRLIQEMDNVSGEFTQRSEYSPTFIPMDIFRECLYTLCGVFPELNLDTIPQADLYGEFMPLYFLKTKNPRRFEFHDNLVLELLRVVCQDTIPGGSSTVIQVCAKILSSISDPHPTLNIGLKASKSARQYYNSVSTSINDPSIPLFAHKVHVKNHTIDTGLTVSPPLGYRMEVSPNPKFTSLNYALVTRYIVGEAAYGLFPIVLEFKSTEKGLAWPFYEDQPCAYLTFHPIQPNRLVWTDSTQ